VVYSFSKKPTFPVAGVQVSPVSQQQGAHPPLAVAIKKVVAVGSSRDRKGVLQMPKTSVWLRLNAVMQRPPGRGSTTTDTKTNTNAESHSSIVTIISTIPSPPSSSSSSSSSWALDKRCHSF